MPLPHEQITPIPNDEPMAYPSLWNDRYREIEENFNHLSHRMNVVDGQVFSLQSTLEYVVSLND